MLSAMPSLRLVPISFTSLCGLAALSLSLTSPAQAASSSMTPALRDSGLELADGTVTSRRHAPLWNYAPRDRSAKASWSALEQRLGVTASQWNPQTGVPLRLWGSGTPAPGSVSSPAKARRFAQKILTEHLDVLAPGAQASDFVIVSEDLSRGVRSIGFVQHYRGREVVGAQLSFRFKADRLVMIASEALTVDGVKLHDAPIASERARTAAVEWLQSGGYGQVQGAAVSGPMILPMIERGSQRFREVMKVEVAAEAPLARAYIYIDAGDGTPVAAQSHLYSGSTTIKANVPVRYPGGEHQEAPLIGIEVDVGGEAKITDEGGTVASPDVPTEIIAGVVGSLVKVNNGAGDPVTESFLLGPGETGLWSYPDDPLIDGPLTNYVSVYRVKQRLMAIDPEFAWLAQQISVTSNLEGECNAFSDGESLFFLRGKDGVCEYTSRLADVSYHEFGHSVHSQALIPGVGAFDGALSEGISDYLAATVTGDPKMGIGFFLDDKPMRDLDPDDYEWHWPEDRGEIHVEGKIIGGALWDLRKALVDKLGEEEGIAKADELWYESIRRASDIPTMYPEALLADDDDGDLANGTPNQCEIEVAFYKHGLVLADAFGATVATLDAGPEGLPVELTVDIAVKEECLGITFTGASLEWRERGSKDVQSVEMDASEVGFIGVIPPQDDGVVIEYQVKTEASDGLVLSFPNNEADPWYQHYFGPVTEIFCTGFESDPEAEGWIKFAEWDFGAPAGLGGDPEAAYEGQGIAGVDLGDVEDGLYDGNRTSRLTSPTIDVSGHDIVRLQYRRWLQVEDSEYDVASIEVGGLTAWINATRGVAPENDNLHHLDREWVFHDLDITPGIVDGTVTLDFVISSDEGLHFGGWNIDGLCIVGVEAPLAPVCGDGVVDAGEDCDDGNVVDGDGCDSTCALEGETSGGETSGGETEGGGTSDGTGTDSATTGVKDGVGDGGCGCDLGSAPSGGSSAFLLFGLLALRRRRS